VLVLTVAVPAAVTVAALLVSWLAWRRTSAATARGDEPGMGRARIVALIGLGSNLLFLSIIAAGGAALLVLPPCST
jgi:hypothetical protein